MKQRLSLIILVAILLAGFAVRLYRFDNPLADWHSWRQAETSSVSRNFAQNGFDLLHPRMVNISNVQSGLENPQGYFFVEFPIYNAAQAGLFKLFGVLTIEQWGRLVSIFSSTFAALFLYLLVSRHSNQKIGLFTAFFYALTPFNIYFGRTILADTSMVMALLGGIYFFDRWVETQDKKHKTNDKQWLWFSLSLLFTTLAFLLKPFSLFFTLPMLYLAITHFRWGIFKKWQLFLFALVSIAPLVAWRMWMMHFPEGIPANQWLFNGNGIRFRPSFFRWIFYERLTLLISGYFGMVFLLFGVYKVRALKEWLFFVSFLVSSLLYVFVVATGNVQHDYYQIPIMPSIAIFFAIGSYYLSLWMVKKIPVGRILLSICLVGFFFFSWQRVGDYFNINHRSIVVAGEAVNRLTPKDAKVIASYNGDTTFLYQTNRSGWASFEKDLPVMIDMGADYLVFANPVKDDYRFEKEYKVVASTKDYIIFDLKARK